MTTGHYICIMKRKILKEDIIKSGYDLFYDKGYGVTGISEITEKIGIPKGSFYNHFKSKEEFGIAVLDFYIISNIDYLVSSLLNEERSPLSNLKKFFKDFIEMQENVLQCSKGCLMGNIAMELADVNSNFQKKSKYGFDSVTKVFTKCLENSKVKNEIHAHLEVESIANFIVNSWQGASLRMKADKSTKPLRNFYNMIFNNLLK
jgi:TetR/AcrR family transcriptional regulator, transcriptional repressor for nem operon